MLELNEANLVKEAQAGNTQAVGELYDRHHQQTYRYVWARVREPRLAEDITGEVFMRMLVKLPSYKIGKTPLQAWLYRIARNLIIDHYRKHGRHDVAGLQEVPELIMEQQAPLAVVERQLTVESVRRALEQIDPKYREVVELRFLAGLSLKEVADTLDRSVASIKTQQHRGLVALRTALKQS